MRIELNISVSKTDTLGTKTETKNIGSISAAGRAAAYEIQRQITALENRETLVQETRGWNDEAGTNFSQRSKEDAKDYRYFPEPDLPKLYLHEIFDLDAMQADLPELPVEKRARYVSEYGIKSEDIESYIGNPDMANFFESVVAEFAGDTNLIKTASNYITSDIIGILKSDAFKNFDGNIWTTLDSSMFATLMNMVNKGDIGSRGAKDILARMMTDGGDPETLADEMGLKQDNDPEALKAIVQKIIDDNPDQVAEFKAGKDTLMKFFVGMAMKETKGAGNPQILTELFEELLK